MAGACAALIGQSLGQGLRRYARPVRGDRGCSGGERQGGQIAYGWGLRHQTVD